MSFLKAGSPKFGKGLAALVLTLPVLSAVPFAAEAAKRINLTVISGNTHHYAPVGAAIKAFMPKVDEILAKTGNYKVSWIQGFGGQIVKVRGELEGVQTGLGDIGVVPGPFHPSKLSLYQIGYVTPFTSADLSTTTAAMSNLLANIRPWVNRPSALTRRSWRFPVRRKIMPFGRTKKLHVLIN